MTPGCRFFCLFVRINVQDNSNDDSGLVEDNGLYNITFL